MNPSAHDEDEAALLDAWMRGSAAAQAELTQRYYGSIRRFFDLRAPQSADDLTQQTFLGVIEARGSFEGRASFKTFIFSIAHKQLLRLLRARHQGPRVQRYGTEAGPVTSLSMVAVRSQEHQLLLMALTQLPVELQVAVELHYWEEMTLAAVGEVLELNPSTVGSRLARARDLLREHIDSMTRPGELRDRLLADIEGWSRALGPVTASANARKRPV